jgi:DNA-binding NarL/FixJ family response regulator
VQPRRFYLAAIRVLIVDDNELVRRGICDLLTSERDLEVICEASTGYEAIRKAEEHRPDVVVLDISMPELNGLQATPLIKKVAESAEILIITNHSDLYFVRASFATGARGFLLKDDISTDLITAIKTAYEKKTFVSRTIRKAGFTTPSADVA